MYGHELQQTYFWYHTSFHHIRQAVYQDFLQKGLAKTVAICGPADQDSFWIMHNSTPPHILLAFWESLNIFPEQQTGKGGPTAWPAHFPYLKPIDFYL
jgi:hypothetical protein